LGDTQDRGHRVGYCRRIGDCGQLENPYPVREFIGNPGGDFQRQPADVLGDRAWFRWSATLGTGESFTGVDFVEFAPDGRIARLTGFYEP
jgi:hypothetical protein